MRYRDIQKISKLLFEYDLMELSEITCLEDEYDLEAELILKRCRTDSICHAAIDIENIFKECFSPSIKLDRQKLECLSLEVIKNIERINKKNNLLEECKMKKGIISILLVGALMVTGVGCQSKTAQLSDAPGKQAAVQKTGDNSDGKGTPPDVVKTPEPAKPDAAQPTPEAKPAGEDDKTAVEYTSGSPVTAVDNVQISPRHVYYKDSKLYMDAYVYNGFKHKLFDFRNISIKLSNKSGVIAEATFDSMGSQSVEANNYIVWTFIFEDDAVKMPKANLYYLRTDYKCDYSY